MNSDICSKYFYYHKKHILKIKIEMKKFTNILWVQGAALQIMVSGICPILKYFGCEQHLFGLKNWLKHRIQKSLGKKLRLWVFFNPAKGGRNSPHHFRWKNSGIELKIAFFHGFSFICASTLLRSDFQGGRRVWDFFRENHLKSWFSFHLHPLSPPEHSESHWGHLRTHWDDCESIEKKSIFFDFFTFREPPF